VRRQSLESYVSRLRGVARRRRGPETFVSMPGGYRLVRDGNRFDHELFIALSDRSSDGAGRGRRRRRERSRHAGARAVAGAGAGGYRRGAGRPGRCRRTRGPASGRDRDSGRGRPRRRPPCPGDRATQCRRVPASHARADPRAPDGGAVSRGSPERRRSRSTARLATISVTSELGLEPGPALRELQARILKHDPSLVARKDEVGTPPGAPTAHASAIRTPRAVRAIGVGCSGRLAAVVGIVRELRTPARPRSTGGSASRRSPSWRSQADGRRARAESGRNSRATSPPARRSEWATSYDDGTLTRIDPATSAVVQTIPWVTAPAGVAIAAGDAWVAESLD
jgi:hypothetical protein